MPTTPLALGLHLQMACAPDQDPTTKARETMAQAVAAEALGFESVWPVEQHFDADTSMLSAPLLFLAAVAARTERLRVGAAVSVLPLHHPVRLAEELLTLDVLSEGRVEIGVGRGIDPNHHRGLGVDPAEGHDRLVEGLQVLRHAWEDERWSFAGRFTDVTDLTVVPRPTRATCPPLRVAANSPATLEQMGRLGHPVFVAAHINPLPTLPERLAAYRSARTEAGHANGPDDVTVLLPLFVGDDERSVRRAVEPSLDALVDRLRRKAVALLPPGSAERERGYQALLDRLDGMTYDSMNGTMALFTTPDRCVEQLAELRADLGAGRVIAWCNPGDRIPHEDVLRSMALLGTEVLPRVNGLDALATAPAALRLAG